MVAESGAVLLDEPARAAIVEELLPLATVITPNLAEARVLAGAGAAGVPAGADAGEAGTPEGGGAAAGAPGGAEAEDLARALHALGPAAVVVTGGHREEATDVFFDGTVLEPIPGERQPGGGAHGSGCTHSSALAAHLALGASPLDAARAARTVAGGAVRDGLRGLGAGAGPVDVFGLTARARERRIRAMIGEAVDRRVT
jgi:hydroxymethylpyrimidine/phosphomethylpyrimidine kinase